MVYKWCCDPGSSTYNNSKMTQQVLEDRDKERNCKHHNTQVNDPSPTPSIADIFHSNLENVVSQPPGHRKHLRRSLPKQPSSRTIEHVLR